MLEDRNREIWSLCGKHLDSAKILHELKIHQIELEMQNDELRKSKFLLEESENRYKRMYHFAPVAYVTMNETGTILEQNLKAGELFATNRKTTDPKPFIVYVHPEDHQKFFSHIAATFSDTDLHDCEIRLKNKQRRLFFARLSSIALEEDSDRCLTAIIDLDELKKNEERVTKMAYNDNLTGLPNRALFIDRVDYAIKHAKRANCKMAVLFIDLDDFKVVNDTSGHKAGDAVLIETSNRMTQCIRETDTLARMGGDEFTILMSRINHEQEAVEVAQRLLKILVDPFIISGVPFYLGASIGISIYPIDGISSDDLLKSADTIMYRCKSQGKNRYGLFNEDNVYVQET